MQNSFFLFVILSILAGCGVGNAQNRAKESKNTYKNPLLYSDWPDPDIIRVEDCYYFISTSMHYVPGCPIAKSYDLLNWEMAGYALDRYDEDSRYDMNGGTMYTRGSWANTIRYRNGTFYVGFCTPNGEEPGHFSMCTAPSPKGPWKRTIFPEYMYDPGLLFDDDGKVYIAHGQGTIYITELNGDALSVKTPQRKVYYNPSHPYLEGSHIYKINGYYYMLNSSSGVQMVCLRSKHIYGPYEEKIVLKDTTHIPYATYPPHQGGMVQSKDGSWWCLIMQDYGPIGRTPNLIPVKWNDGWPMLGVNGKMVSTFTLPFANKIQKRPMLITSDKFRGSEPALEWQWNHNPDTNCFTLTERPGHLRLKPVGIAEELSVARNTITQRVIGPVSTATTYVDLKGMKDGNVAGLTVFQQPYAYIGIRQHGSVRQLIMYNNNQIIDSTTLETNRVYLRATASETGIARFSYSLNGICYRSFGNELKMDLGYPWTANRFGLFIFSTTKSAENGYVDYDWFKIEAK